MPIHTVYAKNALRPMPADRAKGRLAANPITRVAITDDRAVAVKTLPKSIPAAERIIGLTARIYAMVMKVVIPAMISVLTVVFLSFSLKIFSNKKCPLFVVLITRTTLLIISSLGIKGKFLFSCNCGIIPMLCRKEFDHAKNNR